MRLSLWHVFKAASAKPLLTCAHVCVLAGMSVTTIKDGSGMLVHSVVQGGCVGHDGRLGVGDAILAINGEATSNLTNARARAMLRRHSVLGPEMRWGPTKAIYDFTSRCDTTLTIHSHFYFYLCIFRSIFRESFPNQFSIGVGSWQSVNNRFYHLKDRVDVPPLGRFPNRTCSQKTPSRFVN